MKNVLPFVLLSTLLLLTSLVPAVAQDFLFGVKGGLNVSTLGGSGGGNANARAGFHLGGYVIAPLSERIALQAEIVYSQQGYRNPPIFVNAFNVAYDYINVPIIGKIYASDNFNVQVGPQIGFLISSDVGSTRTVDAGVVLGIGYDMDSGLNFAARYNLGLTNVNAFAPNALTNFTLANRVFQLSVGYTLRARGTGGKTKR